MKTIVLLGILPPCPFSQSYPVLLEEILKSQLGSRRPFLDERLQIHRTWRSVTETWYEEVELRSPVFVAIEAHQEKEDTAALDEILDRSIRCAIPRVALLPRDLLSLAYLEQKFTHLNGGKTQFFLPGTPLVGALDTKAKHFQIAAWLAQLAFTNVRTAPPVRSRGIDADQPWN